MRCQPKCRMEVLQKRLSSATRLASTRVKFTAARQDENHSRLMVTWRLREGLSGELDHLVRQLLTTIRLPHVWSGSQVVRIIDSRSDYD